MDCNKENNLKNCSCTYSSCGKKGICCECIKSHLTKKELPGCVFAKVSKDAEKSYDRSFGYFTELVK